jgi:hypothetical protein
MTGGRGTMITATDGEGRIIHIILQEDVRGARYINKIMEVYGK